MQIHLEKKEKYGSDFVQSFSQHTYFPIYSGNWDANLLFSIWLSLPLAFLKVKRFHHADHSFNVPRDNWEEVKWEGLEGRSWDSPGSGAVVMDGNSDPGHAQLCGEGGLSLIPTKAVTQLWLFQVCTGLVMERINMQIWPKEIKCSQIQL